MQTLPDGTTICEIPDIVIENEYFPSRETVTQARQKVTAAVCCSEDLGPVSAPLVARFMRDSSEWEELERVRKEAKKRKNAKRRERAKRKKEIDRKTEK
jgi:hypothetical protein